jgi:hypothetical protein
LNAALVPPALLVQLSYDNLYESIEFFTYHMRSAGGVVPAIVGIALLYKCLSQIEKKHLASPVYTSTVLSIILFGGGGLLSFAIDGTNTMIPAHYHGSIVGITMACMGLCYHLLPSLGYKTPTGKMAILQPYCYGLGQGLHVSGLALMGGYGALRKAPGTSQSIDTVVGKLMFFSGGVLAITGGLLFVIVVLRCIIARHNGKVT